MIIATIIENISVDSLFAKNLPKETRAILNGAYSFSGNIGVLLYSLLSGWLVDNVGPKSPFAVIGLLDIIFGAAVYVWSERIFYKHEDKSRKVLLKKSQRSSEFAVHKDM